MVIWLSAGNWETAIYHLITHTESKLSAQQKYLSIIFQEMSIKTEEYAVQKR